MNKIISAQDFEALRELLSAEVYNERGSGTRFCFKVNGTIRVEVQFYRLFERHGELYFNGSGYYPTTHYKTEGYDAVHFTGTGSRDLNMRFSVRKYLRDLTGIDVFAPDLDLSKAAAPVAMCRNEDEVAQARAGGFSVRMI